MVDEWWSKEKNKAYLRKLCHRFRVGQEADDILSEAYLAIKCNELNIREMRGYAFIVVKNICIRTKKQLKELVTLGNNDVHCELCSENPLLSLLRKEIDSLTNESHKAIMEEVLRGKKVKSVKERAVKSRFIRNLRGKYADNVCGLRG